MSRRRLGVSLLTVATLLFIACGGGGDGDETPTTAPPTSTPIPSAEQPLQNLESFEATVDITDDDGDGGAERVAYVLPTTEVADGLFLERRLEYERTDDGFFGTIVLAFDGDASGYEHIERIPKSLAESVDDLEFSIEPTEVVDADPVVRWEAGRLVVVPR